MTITHKLQLKGQTKVEHITGNPNTVDSGDKGKADCFDKVIYHQAREYKVDPNEGTLGSHASDPVPVPKVQGGK